METWQCLTDSHRSLEWNTTNSWMRRNNNSQRGCGHQPASSSDSARQYRMQSCLKSSQKSLAHHLQTMVEHTCAHDHGLVESHFHTHIPPNVWCTGLGHSAGCWSRCTWVVEWERGYPAHCDPCMQNQTIGWLIAVMWWIDMPIYNCDSHVIVVW